VRAERRVARPARRRAAARRDHPEDQHQPGDRQQPERERVQLRERHVGGADHQRDDEVPERGEARDDDQEDHQCRVVRDQDVERLRVEVLVARLGELGAEEEREEARNQEEREDGAEILHPDHLVVGVDAEVVLPGLRTVAFVQIGPRRFAGHVVEPVVEATDAEQEAEREDNERNGEDRSARPDRMPVGGPADQAGDGEPEEAEERREPEDPQPAGSGEAMPARRRRLRRVVFVAVRDLRVDVCGFRHFVFSTR
jgi:hypothetical protein